jgi:hypothetical protein
MPKVVIEESNLDGFVEVSVASINILDICCVITYIMLLIILLTLVVLFIFSF